MKIYTRTGDKGTTSLVGGQRVAKDTCRLEAYGTVDEFSSHIGLLMSRPDLPEDVHALLEKVQNRMFDMGAYLATMPEPGTTPEPKGLDQASIEEIEDAIDRLNEELPPLDSFVLPGGTASAAIAHICRTVCRRAERRVITLAGESYVSPVAVGYLNRLSDYLFVLARYINHKAGVKDIAWHPVCNK